MEYHIVKRVRGEPAQIIETFYDRDEALGIMEDYVREVMAKKNGEDSVRLVEQKIASKQRYQNDEYAVDVSCPKVCHKFPLMNVERHYGPESSEWKPITLGTYFAVRSREDLFRLSVYHKKETRGVFRNGWTTVKLFDIEIVVNLTSSDLFEEEDSWSNIYEVCYDGKDIGSAAQALANEHRDNVVTWFMESEEFAGLRTPEHGFEPEPEPEVKEVEETPEVEENSAEEKTVEKEKSPYYKGDE